MSTVLDGDGATAPHAKPAEAEPEGADRAVIRVLDVCKVYEPSPPWLGMLLRSAIPEEVVALDGVSLEVGRGQIHVVMGPNGAGKSTLFRILIGLTTPTAGSASILGMDVTSHTTEIGRVVGYMPAEDRSLLLRHTCWENLVFHGRLHGMAKADLERRALEVLDLVGLGHARRRVGFALSSGMRARLQLARAILHDPPVLVLDEPTGTLDPVSAHELVALVQKITVERGMAVLLSSHRIEDIESLRDHVLLLNNGRAVYQGDLDSLRTLWERPIIEIGFTHEDQARTAALLLEDADDVDVVNVDPPRLRVVTTGSVGELLTRFDGRLGEIAMIQRTRLPLRDLLAQILRSDDGANPGGNR